MAHTRTQNLALVFTLAAWTTLHAAPPLEGLVVSIADGDTFTLLTVEKRQVRIRLAEIDSPEDGQPFSNPSSRALAELVFRKRVTIVPTDVDRYGRTVGQVYVDGVHVNAKLIEDGHAWAIRQYLEDRKLLELEAAARAAGRGLWAAADPIPPWEWRRRERAAAQAAALTASQGKIIGNRRSKVYHLPSGCPGYGDVSEENRVLFGNQEAAIDAGFRMARNCEAFLADTTTDAARAIAPSPDPACDIKGNINRKGDKIYHTTSSPWYRKTVVTEAKGERWFCTEEEAADAGWRAPTGP